MKTGLRMCGMWAPAGRAATKHTRCAHEAGSRSTHHCRGVCARAQTSPSPPFSAASCMHP
eukprot:350897-Chlamydomonas_euryale.AAC.7